MKKHYYINGQILPADEARIRLDDIGLLRGFGTFDYFTIRGGKPLFLGDHLQRFQRSAQGMGLTLPIGMEEIEQVIYQLTNINKTFDAGIRLVLTGGYSPDSFTPVEPNFLILEHALKIPDLTSYESGVHLLKHQYTREIPAIKTLNYAIPILEIGRMKAAGAFDLLYHDGQEVSESSRSNFFAVLPGKRIITPAQNILKGITRQYILEVARFTNYSVEEGSLRLADLAQAEEAFLTNSILGLLPVVKIDELLVGNGKVGSVTQELIAYWEDYVEQYLSAVPYELQE